jgi:hypothetical protein
MIPSELIDIGSPHRIDLSAVVREETSSGPGQA